MNTITIDNNTYNDLVAYAKQHNVSIDYAVKSGLRAFLNSKASQPKTQKKYYISSEVRSLESNFKCPEGLSLDYRKEISDIIQAKNL